MDDLNVCHIKQTGEWGKKVESESKVKAKYVRFSQNIYICVACVCWIEEKKLCALIENSIYHLEIAHISTRCREKNGFRLFFDLFLLPFFSKPISKKCTLENVNRHCLLC